MARLMARVFTRRRANAVSSASISVSISAMAVCSSIRGILIGASRRSMFSKLT
jgi:hypothetical protein